MQWHLQGSLDKSIWIAKTYYLVSLGSHFKSCNSSNLHLFHWKIILCVHFIKEKPLYFTYPKTEGNFGIYSAVAEYRLACTRPWLQSLVLQKQNAHKEVSFLPILKANKKNCGLHWLKLKKMIPIPKGDHFLEILTIACWNMSIHLGSNIIIQKR